MRSPMLDRIEDEEKRALVITWLRDEAMSALAFIVLVAGLLLLLLY